MFMFALGIIMGNIVFYSIIEKNPVKGSAIGFIAALLYLIFAPLLGLN